MSPRMHVDEVATDVDLVRRLLRSQMPDWAELPLAPVPSSGTDNALYRLGDDMVVRLPRIHWAVAGLEKELAWLPTLAPRLPVAVPVPLRVGEPDEGFPSRWAVYSWLPGANPPLGGNGAIAKVSLVIWPRSSRRSSASRSRGRRRVAGSRSPPRTNGRRPPCPSSRDRSTPRRRGRPGRTRFASPAGRGHPSGCTVTSSLIAAWSVLSPDGRSRFRSELGVDDDTWARGRGWALSVALVALPYYRETNPGFAAVARHVLAQVLSDG